MASFERALGYAALTGLFFNVVGCGGGDGEPSPAPAPAPAPPGPTVQERVNAATQTADTNLACNSGALPEGFYWEIGDRNGSLASGTVSGTNTPTASQVIAVASSSKWVYSTCVLQQLGSVRTSDVPFLHFTSGDVFPAANATKEVFCGPTETVGQCAADAVQSPLVIVKLLCSSGRFQYHAANVMGLGSLDASTLTTKVTTQVGSFDFAYLQTNLAAGLMPVPAATRPSCGACCAAST